LAEVYSKSRAEGFGDEAKRRIMTGTYVLSAGYYEASDRQAAVIDPETGTLLKRVAMPSDAGYFHHGLKATSIDCAGKDCQSRALRFPATPAASDDRLDFVTLRLTAGGASADPAARTIYLCLAPEESKTGTKEPACMTRPIIRVLPEGSRDLTICLAGLACPPDSAGPQDDVTSLPSWSVPRGPWTVLLRQAKPDPKNEITIDRLALDVAVSWRVKSMDCGADKDRHGFTTCVGSTSHQVNLLYRHNPVTGESEFIGPDKRTALAR
jgi:hypothetical protein